MSEKCCCGCCTLSSGTSIALAICAIQALFGLLWNTEMLMLLNDNKSFNPLQAIINVRTLDDFDVVHGITLAGLGLNSFWLISAVIAARGNITLSHGQLAFWDIQTYFITLFDTGATIYFTVKAQGLLAEGHPFFLSDGHASKTLTYLVLLLVSSKGVFLLLLNIFLAHLVQMRGKEIDSDHSVLALYVLSHLARCRSANDDILRLIPNVPPTYASSCPLNVGPVSTSERRSDSDGSTWSLSYDAMKCMNELPTFQSCAGNQNVRPSIDMARALSINPSCNSQVMNFKTVSSTLLP